MAILQSVNLAFYHPLNDLDDGASVTWGASPVTSWNATHSFVVGKVGNSLSITGASNGATGDGQAGSYGNMDSGTRWTQAWWMNLPDLVSERGVIGGFVTGSGFASSGSPAQVLQVNGDGQIRVFLGSETAGGNSPSIATSTGIVAVATGWHFYVVDMERSGGDWVLRHSVDGAAWTEESPITAGVLTGGTVEAMIGLFDSAKVDEFAIWKDGDLFTSQELANLYDLANTYSLSLDQYTGQFTGLSIASDPSGVSVTVSPNDNDGDGDGTTPFTRSYASSTDVTLTAPSASGGRPFAGWRNGDGDTLSLSRSLTLTISAAATLTAHYESIGDSKDDYIVAS